MPFDYMNLQRPNGRPVGARTGMGPQPAGVMNPQLGGMQFTQSPVAQPQAVQPVGMGQPVNQQLPQQRLVNQRYAQNVLNKYGMQGY